MRLIVLTKLAYDLNSSLDTGKFNHISKKDIWQQIEKGSIFPYLRETLSIDLSPTGDEMLELIDQWDGYMNAQDAREKFAIERRNGLSLLLAYVVEGLQQAVNK